MFIARVPDEAPIRLALVARRDRRPHCRGQIKHSPVAALSVGYYSMAIFTLRYWFVRHLSVHFPHWCVEFVVSDSLF